MSSALAISGVTAVLQYYLGNRLQRSELALRRTSRSRRRRRTSSRTASATARRLQNQVNRLPASGHAQRRLAQRRTCPRSPPTVRPALKNPPLALDLHYLLTAYASEDRQAEALLGYAHADAARESGAAARRHQPAP